MRLLSRVILGATSGSHYSSRALSGVARPIYFSKCTDIFTNLALEDWLYTNMDFTERPLLMLWRNEPCVVIGRHQNPWLECNFPALPGIARGVKLARRNSGGGTVYHDMENLNLTFFTSRKEYSRRRNLELISRALEDGFGIRSEINGREDLCVGDLKISGTASKLGRTNAYHHCTLLVNADKENLSLALKNVLGETIKTNASVSVRSKIMNLSEIKPDITVDQVTEAVVMEYKRKAQASGVEVISSIDDGKFPGVTEIKKMYLSTEWRFERTPKFTVFRDIFNDLVPNVEAANTASAFLVVEKGKVSNAGIANKDVNLSVKDTNLRDLHELFSGLVGKPFSKQILDEFDMVVSGLRSSDKCRSMVVNR